MKRTLEEMQAQNHQNGSAQTNGGTTAQESLYDATAKKRKLDSQRVGQFIVKTDKSIHFKVANDSKQEQYFGPTFTHQVFDEKGQIKGYENLSIDITLSPKFLVPLVRVTYTEKAPASASVDDIEEKLRNHYGKIYTDAAKYQQEVLDEEKKLGKFGDKLCTLTAKQGGKTFDLNKICTTAENDGFQER